MKCAEIHYRDSRHPLTISLSHGNIFCYQCDETYSDLINNVMCELSAKQKIDRSKLKEFTDII
jgi:uncharacterized UBP type Zn finger protein